MDIARHARGNHPYVLLALMTLVVTVNYVDRYVLSILAEPIRAELKLNDTQLGLLTGAGFALVYAFLALPIARLAERTNRVVILTVALLLWSLATAFCGVATSFALLLAGRVMVGLGEAGAVSPSISMVTDVFPIEKRGVAMGIYGLGGALGAALAPLIGGGLEPHLGWRMTLVVMGLAGLPLALLMAVVVREPPRGFSDGLTAPPAALAVGESLKRLFRRPSFTLVTLALICMAIGEYSQILWMPALLHRTFGGEMSALGAKLAAYQGIPYFAGTILGGLVIDRLFKRDRRWIAWTPMIGALITIPSIIGVLLTRTESLAFALLIVPSFVNGLYIAPSYAMTQNLAAAHSRATATAVLAFSVNLVAAGVAPFAVGLLSDTLTAHYGSAALSYALLTLAPIYLTAAGIFAVIGLTVRRDLDDAHADNMSTQAAQPNFA